MGVKTLAHVMAGRMAQKKPTENVMSSKRKVLLKSRIELAQSEARNFIEDQAHAVAKEAPGVPFEAIKTQIRRGLCDCVAALLLIEGDDGPA